MHDVYIYFRRFHLIYLSTNIKNVPRSIGHKYFANIWLGIFLVQIYRQK